MGESADADDVDPHRAERRHAIERDATGDLDDGFACDDVDGFADELPRTASGKVKKNELRDRL